MHPLYDADESRELEKGRMEVSGTLRIPPLMAHHPMTIAHVVLVALILSLTDCFYRGFLVSSSSIHSVIRRRPALIGESGGLECSIY